MANSEPTDGELLADWLTTRREAAFRSLVERHAGMVHAAARRVAGDDGAAAEVSQAVFILLARRAAFLHTRPTLAGWLYITAVMQAKNLMRRNLREIKKRQRLLDEMKTTPAQEGGDGWRELRPVIDDAIASLPEKDRETVLLHFYHAMSVGEMAARLGIATDAARKRLERATARLRSKLARRGYEPGGAFNMVLTAGFAAELNAPVGTIHALSSKALAACAAQGPVSTATLATATTVMKATPFVPPVIALIVVGFWISPKWEALAAVGKKEVSTRAGHLRGSGGTAGDAVRSSRRNVVPMGGGKCIAWEKIGAMMTEKHISGRLVTMSTIEDTSLDYLLGKLSVEGLVAELDEVAKVDMEETARIMIESSILYLLMKKDPAVVLALAEEKVAKPRYSYMMKDAVLAMAKKDPVAAAAWLDRQVAEGKLETKRLDGKNPLRMRLEVALLEQMSVKDLEAASSRLEGMSPKTRMEVMGMIGELSIYDQASEAAYVGLARRHLTPEECRKTLGIVAWNMESRRVDSYLERIKATPDERKVICEMAAIGSISNKPLNGKLTMADLAETRAWLERTAPVEADRVIGEALGKALEHGPASFSEIASLAAGFRGTDGNDEFLVAFLCSKGARGKKDEARAMAAEITDPVRRAEVLEALE
ncbi:sigma-70 family RNA polymerase sigma factor [Luteolibacter sp. SL250]|uniref:RNA polymerase sigma factor n=1 Tax=Luteolibacter sp. SL250 TaxID=2995170 RepID=UPI0022700C41|nr:sigma-70 family RNA polymerase sigma factor [Luteolibacter sp. SL250]WAC19444.1 sigma-70 family RNA polymerase sigma factor [Luteolibacter sp. SL250]